MKTFLTSLSFDSALRCARIVEELRIHQEQIYFLDPTRSCTRL